MAGSANPAMTVNPFQQASAAQSQALQTYANPSATAMNMMNPYQQNVVDKTLRDVGSAAQMGMNTLDAQAQAAGAFGGSRHGIQGAEALKGYQQQALDQVGALNQQGYNTAMNDAFRSASGLQNAGQQSFGYGQAIQNQQMQQGAMQQQMMQDLINSGKGMFGGFVGQPAQNLNNLIGTISAQPTLSGSTSSFQPGLFNYFQTLSSMPRG
ncbi:MAG: hypothetical protein ACR2ON_00090 [Paracoccaceae bacterium]